MPSFYFFFRAAFAWNLLMAPKWITAKWEPYHCIFAKALSLIEDHSHPHTVGKATELASIRITYLKSNELQWRFTIQASEAVSPVNLLLLAFVNGQEHDLIEENQSYFLAAWPLIPGGEPAP